MKHMPDVPTLRLFVRSLRYYGYSPLQILDAMTKRLALDRFDAMAMDEEDKTKRGELEEYLKELEAEVSSR